MLCLRGNALQVWSCQILYYNSNKKGYFCLTEVYSHVWNRDWSWLWLVSHSCKSQLLWVALWSHRQGHCPGLPPSRATHRVTVQGCLLSVAPAQTPGVTVRGLQGWTLHWLPFLSPYQRAYVCFGYVQPLSRFLVSSPPSAPLVLKELFVINQS